MTREVPYAKLSGPQIIGSVGYADKQVLVPQKGNPLILKIMRWCLAKDRTRRPKTSQVLEALTDDNNKQEKQSELCCSVTLTEITLCRESRTRAHSFFWEMTGVPKLIP